MIAGRPAEILRQLEAPAVPERELLSRFVRERDQAAFAELVRRHGPVVLCVCKRVTGHQQDAEDAFQAVFLLLARKAAAIAQPDLLGNWLYGVAVRISQTARRSAKRRRAREVVVRVMPELATSRNKEIAELNPILDEELTALPSWYREAIVLCDLRGVSREEAARVLGVPEGTLSSRLANGRKKLAARLAKRGIAISVAAVPTTLSTTQAATVPAELFAKTCSLVADWAAGGTIPKPLAKLIQGGITVRKTLLFGLLTAAVAASGVVYGTQSPETTLPVDPPRPSVVAARTEAAEQPAPETKPGDKSVTYTSKPKLQDSIDIELHGNLVVLWNMQGTRIAIRGTRYLGNLPGTPLPGGAIPNPPDTRREQAAVAVFPIPAIAAKESISPQVVWNINNKIRFVGSTPDGQYFLTVIREYQLVSGQHKLGFWGEDKVSVISNFDTIGPRAIQKIVRSVNLDPTETQGYAFAADGKTFRTVGIERDPATQQISNLNVLEVDATTGQHLKKLLTASSSTFALSSDGKRLAAKTGSAVIIYDLDRAAKLSSYTLKEEVKLLPPAYLENGYQTWSEQQVPYLKFSPDGHRLIVCISPEKIGYRYGRSNFTNATGGSEISGLLGQTVVLNAETGEALPALEGAECLEALNGSYPFTHDGRLLALSGTQHDVKKEKVGKNDLERIVLKSSRNFLTVWDTQTGKVLKTWNQSPQVAFNPARPLLAVLEPNGDETRLGFWDFSAEVADKK